MQTDEGDGVYHVGIGVKKTPRSVYTPMPDEELLIWTEDGTFYSCLVMAVVPHARNRSFLLSIANVHAI
jgi:hypothetical protein